MNKFSFEDLQKANKAIEKASDSDRPYAVAKGDDVLVIGDANDVAPHTMNAVVQFRFEIDELQEIPKGAKTVMNRWVLIDQSFTDIFISPQDDLKIVEAFMGVYPFFAEVQEIEENKKEALEKATDENERKKIEIEHERLLLHEYNYGQGVKTSEELYNFVAIMLGLDDYMKSHMTSMSCLVVFIQITEAFPELVREAETLFGLSSVERVMN